MDLESAKPRNSDKTEMEVYTRVEMVSKNAEDVKVGVRVLGKDFLLGDASKSLKKTVQTRKMKKAKRRVKKLNAKEMEEDLKAANLISGWIQQL